MGARRLCCFNPENACLFPLGFFAALRWGLPER